MGLIASRDAYVCHSHFTEEGTESVGASGRGHTVRLAMGPGLDPQHSAPFSAQSPPVLVIKGSKST